MSAHQLVPVSLDLDETATEPPSWRCVGCGRRSEFRDAFEDEDADCPALALPLVEGGQ